MKVSDVIIKCLKQENVTHIFGYPGGAVLPLYESLRNSDLKHILVRNEQSAAHCASGFSRAKGEVGVCLATSGPGATNLITGIATAYMDSIPMVVITGQVASENIGKDVFQEADVVGSTDAFTKHNYLVKDAKDIPRIFKEAFYIAASGRPGPVLIDVPVDIQKIEIDYKYPKDVDIIGYKPTLVGHQGQVKRAIRELKKASKPVVCVGGGINSSNAFKELEFFVEKLQIPLVHTMMGIGAVPTNEELNFGMIGSHGTVVANKLIRECDLLIVIGTRIGDRAIKKLEHEEKGAIIHIDIDPAEVGKNIPSSIPIIGDAKNVLMQINKLLPEISFNEWSKEVLGRKKQEEVKLTSHINPKEAISYLSKMSKNKTIVTADVGQNQIWAARNFDFKLGDKFLSSGGLGTMGYSLSAAIGAKMGDERSDVYCVIGDGGIQMFLGEMGTLSEHDLGVVVILFNNNRLGMVKELQDNAYGKGKTHGIEFGMNPDFTMLAKAYNIDSHRVTNNEEFNKVIDDIIKIRGTKSKKNKKSVLIECVVDPDFKTI